MASSNSQGNQFFRGSSGIPTPTMLQMKYKWNQLNNIAERSAQISQEAKYMQKQIQQFQDTDDEGIEGQANDIVFRVVEKKAKKLKSTKLIQTLYKMKKRRPIVKYISEVKSQLGTLYDQDLKLRKKQEKISPQMDFQQLQIQLQSMNQSNNVLASQLNRVLLQLSVLYGKKQQMEQSVDSFKKQVYALSEEINTLKSSQKDQYKRIYLLKQQLRDKQQIFNGKERLFVDQINSLLQKIQGYEISQQNSFQSAQDMNKTIIEKNKLINRLEKLLRDKQQQLDRIVISSNDSKQKLESKTNQLSDKLRNMVALNKKLNSKQQKLLQLNSRLQQEKKLLQNLSDQLKKQLQRISSLLKSMQERKIRLQKRLRINKNRQNTIIIKPTKSYVDSNSQTIEQQSIQLQSQGQTVIQLGDSSISANIKDDQLYIGLTMQNKYYTNRYVKIPVRYMNLIRPLFLQGLSRFHSSKTIILFPSSQIAWIFDQYHGKKFAGLRMIAWYNNTPHPTRNGVNFTLNEAQQLVDRLYTFDR